MKLQDAGLRCTRQRIELGRLLFAKGDRHFTADLLHEEAKLNQIPVSLATIYNTLQLFMTVGLVRRLATGGQKTWFDTNVSEHHHLVLEDESRIIDIPAGYLTVHKLPPIPEDTEIDVEVTKIQSLIGRQPLADLLVARFPEVLAQPDAQQPKISRLKACAAANSDVIDTWR